MAVGLRELSVGALLGMCTRDAALKAFKLKTKGAVLSISWLGTALAADLDDEGFVRVTVEEKNGRLTCSCARCGERICPHCVAAMHQWIDVRSSLLKHGPGSVWEASYGVVIPGQDETDRNITPLGERGVLDAIRTAVCVAYNGYCEASLVNGREVLLRYKDSAGREHRLRFSAALLPNLLPALKEIPKLRLLGTLGKLEILPAAARPVLVAKWSGDGGISLEPSYRLSKNLLISKETVEKGSLGGGWVLLGRLVFRLLDPASQIARWFESGRKILLGKEAVRFLREEHTRLWGSAHYVPRGPLASIEGVAAPQLAGFSVRSPSPGRFEILARWSLHGKELTPSELRELVKKQVIQRDGSVLLAPELGVLKRFRVPQAVASRWVPVSAATLLRLIASIGADVRPLDEASQDFLKRITDPLEAVESVPGLSSRLRPYQREGVAWLYRMWTLGLGCILADEMGLGKTHQAMGLIALAAEAGARDFLVLAPRGVLGHWSKLLANYMPMMKVVLFHGSERALPVMGVGAKLVLTTYETALRSRGALEKRVWDVIVFDEAQKVKNPKTQLSRCARGLRGKFKVALTGTPLENHLLELWSVVDLVLPGYLGSRRAFKMELLARGEDAPQWARSQVAPVMLRRTKEQVLNQLPRKAEEVVDCPMSGEQARLYQMWEHRAVEKLKEMADGMPEGAKVSSLHVFTLLAKLKQVCDHPALVEPGWPDDELPGKMVVLDELLDEAIASGKKVVVFSQFVKMLELLSRHLKKRGLQHLMLTGKTRDRASVVERFNRQNTEPVLLASLLASGLGIDLTAASVVVHYDRWWNPARENQATDRVHRFGQKRFVQVFKLQTPGTIEERIASLIEEKMGMARVVLKPTSNLLAQLSLDELLALFGEGTSSRLSL